VPPVVEEEKPSKNEAPAAKKAKTSSSAEVEAEAKSSWVAVECATAFPNKYEQNI